MNAHLPRLHDLGIARQRCGTPARRECRRATSVRRRCFPPRFSFNGRADPGGLAKCQPSCSTIASLGSLLALPLATGCVVYAGAKPSKEVPTRSPPPPPTTGPRASRRRAGPGFWIWRGPKDGWHVRTTTSGKEHSFRGEVAVVGGNGVMTDLRANRFELNDRVRGNPSGAAFEFKTAGFRTASTSESIPATAWTSTSSSTARASPAESTSGGGRPNHHATTSSSATEPPTRGVDTARHGR